MATDIQAAQENRLSLFANVFKGYMGIMPIVTAEGAFVLMALRDYCNDVRHFSEYDWMFGPLDGSAPPLAARGTSISQN